MNSNDDIKLKIISLIDKIRPFLINDGGNLEFVKYEDNIVYVRLLGACADCAMMDITLKDGIEELIINEIPEVKEVRNMISED
jgi:Fe-S cluster biogenesis protein NfuA